MAYLNLSGINEVEIVTSALFEYQRSMLNLGNIARASKIIDLLQRIDRLASFDCPDDCLNCPNFLNLKECGYEASNKG